MYFTAGCAPYVPAKGTVGASGDLAPLSHVALNLMGEGKMWGPKTGWAETSMVGLLEHAHIFLKYYLIENTCIT